jgi:iron(III) transport system permease protein
VPYAIANRDYKKPTAYGALLPWAITLVGVALLALPIVGLIAAAFEPGSGKAWSGFLSQVLPGYAWNSLVLALGVAAGTIALGTGAAWIIERYEFWGRNTLAWALMLPLAIPAYVSAYAVTDFLAFAGPLQTALRGAFAWQKGDYWFPDFFSLGGAIALFSLALYPYVYFLARDAFAERGLQLVDAARTLGLSPKQAWWRVALPVARPAVIGGALLAVMETLADYGAVSYLNIETFTVGVFRSWFNLGNKSAAAQLSLLLLVVIGVLVLIETKLRRRARFTPTRAGHAPRRQRVRGHSAAWLFGLCVLPVALGFIAPIFLLLRMLLGSTETVWTPALQSAIFDSLRLGVGTALGCCALVIASALTLRRLARVRGAEALQNTSGAIHKTLALAYAVPGAVLAVGLLTPLAFLDRIAPSPWFTGTMCAVLLGCIIRFYGVAANSIDAALARIPRSVDDATQALGVRGAQALREVYFPLIKRAAGSALLLVFVDTLKELPATLSLRPFNFDTLATLTHTLTKDERLAEAAAPSLIIVAICLIPIWVLARGRK